MYSAHGAARLACRGASAVAVRRCRRDRRCWDPHLGAMQAVRIDAHRRRASAELSRRRRCSLRYRLCAADIDEIASCLPPSAPVRADELWQTTCFEAFLAPATEPALSRVQLLAVDAMGGLRLRRLSRGHAATLPIAPPEIGAARADGSCDLTPRSIARARPASLPARPLRGDRGERTATNPTGRSRIRRASRISIIRTCFALELPAADARMKFGIDRLLADPALRAPLEGKRVALLAHPASVTADLTHSLDALAACGAQPHRRLRPAARPARRQAGQYGRIAGLHRSGRTASRCSASTARCAGRPARRWARST